MYEHLAFVFAYVSNEYLYQFYFSKKARIIEAADGI